MSYFHPMTFDMDTGRYVLRLPTTIPPVRMLLVPTHCVLLRRMHARGRPLRGSPANRHAMHMRAWCA